MICIHIRNRKEGANESGSIVAQTREQVLSNRRRMMQSFCFLFHKFELVEFFLKQLEHPKKARKGPDKFQLRVGPKQSTIFLKIELKVPFG